MASIVNSVCEIIRLMSETKVECIQITYEIGGVIEQKCRRSDCSQKNSFVNKNTILISNKRAASKSYLPRFEGGINCYRFAYSKNVQNFGIYSGKTKKSNFK
ncbi:hypothetical protein COJ07_24515 [Bacillus cereus]|uniref:Uncharacterized protein n=1 Tax=Bacillus cereus TaxID=1396 RepID=A0A2B3U1I5_BACCE|nr:hypothetical protein COJ07_24515 [Bacillus cereus]PFU40387.1 hypothetical protein COK86_19665 [Bacillus cereus]